MECPQCKKEMEKGYLESAARILWSKDKNKYRIKKINSDDVIRLTPLPVFEILNLDGYICKKCQIIVTKY